MRTKANNANPCVPIANPSSEYFLKVQRTGFSAYFSEVSEFQSACGGKAAVVAPFNPHYPASSYNQLATNEPVFLQSANFPGIVKATYL